jgi:WS/DGAT/MGAT family acyltransferase
MFDPVRDPGRDPIALDPEPLAPGVAGVPLADVDVAWLRMDEPANRMHVHGVLVLDGDVPAEQVASRLAERFAVIPRFGQKVARARRGFVWTDDPEFDIARHVTEERLDAPGGDAELARAIEAHLPRALDRRHPLWEFRALRGYRGGDTAVLARLHHAIGDGVALMAVLLALTDWEPAEGGGTVPSNPFLELFSARAAEALAQAHAAAERAMPETLKLMLAPVEAYGQLGAAARRAASVVSAARLLATRNEPASRFKGRLAVAKRVAWTEPFALDEVKRVGRAHGATLNEVLNSTMAGALRRYLGRDAALPESFAVRCATPVNLRPLEEMAALGNRFGLVFLPLPVGVADPLCRLAELRRRSAALKRSTEPLMVFSLLKWAGRLPDFAQDLLIRIFGAKATAVFTNVPGPRAAIGFAGHEVRDLFFWVPQAGRLGLGLSILSYRGEVRLGIASDALLVPDPERIVEGFYAEWEALLDLS